MTHLARSSQQIGAIIRRQRLLKQLTQKQLAAQLAIRQATVSEIEVGKKGARLSTLLEILATLELEMTIASRTKGSAKDIEDVF